MFSLDVVAVERIPAQGPGVVVAPHRSWLDPPCVAAACPRPIRFLIMDRVFQMKRARWFYRAMRSIPVVPESAGASLALRAAIRALQAGELIGVFPEGRVIPLGQVGPIHPGAAMLAVRTRAPVLPMHVTGSAKAWPHGRSWPGRGPVRVKVGEPMDPPVERGRQAIDEMRRRIEESFQDMAMRESS